MNNLKEKINSLLPWYDCVLPFSKLEVSFTPFKVKDAKNISIILQEENSILGLKHLIEILKNNTNLKGIDNLCLADAEYLFLQIRAKSVEEKIDLVIEDDKKISFALKIDDIKFEPGKLTKTVHITNNILLELKQPTVMDYISVDSIDDELMFTKIIKSI